MTHMLRNIALILLTALAGACSGSSAHTSTATAPADSAATRTVPQFDADSAYSFVAQQVEMGPRVNGTAPHRRCQEWIAGKLRSFSADSIIEQRATLKDWKGRPVEANNILGRYNPQASSRILLVAHYDTRPEADEDPDPERRSTPVPGANDGASGVGVLMEIARQFSLQTPSVGVDLLFTDAEDAGSNSDTPGTSSEDSWCLGTQYWLTDLPYTATSRPLYGILLDMVGGRDAVFHPEIYSMHYAPDVVARVWNAAREAGYASRFPTSRGGGVTDDHLFINRAGIPCIDIIECNNPVTGSFPPYWHTTADDMTNISPETLKAVGQTVTSVVYSQR